MQLSKTTSALRRRKFSCLLGIPRRSAVENEAKVVKLQIKHGHGVEIASNKVATYNEMVKDGVSDYEAVILELQHYEERYKLLENT